MGGVKTISIIVAANIKGLEAGLGKANKSLASFASKSARLGSMLSFGVTAPLAAMGKQAFDTFSQFENSMMKVNTVTGATASEFKMLTDKAKKLGATTQFTASQVADLQLILGRKGFDPTAIKNMQGSILDLALATGEDLSLAAETVASSINAFGLETQEASRVANTLASAAANSSVQLSTFTTAFGHAGASAKAVGVDIEELSAMMGVLMDNGIKASKAGTGLRKAFMKLNQEGIPFIKTLKDLSNGNMSLNEAQDLVGTTAANQLLILSKNQEKLSDLTKEYKTNTGRLEEMADAMGNTTFAKIKKMQSAIESMNIELGALIADAILPIIEKITDLASDFGKLDDQTKRMIITFGGIMMALGPVMIGIGALISLVNPLTIGITALGAAFVALGVSSKKTKSPLEQENDNLNNLAANAMSAAEGTEERLEAINKLQEQYPSFLSNLKAEEISNNDIKIALESSNEEFIKKLKLQIQENKLLDLKNTKTEEGNRLASEQLKAQQKVRDISKKTSFSVPDDFTAFEKVQTLLDNIQVEQKGISILTGDITYGYSLLGKEISKFEYEDLINLKNNLAEINREFDSGSSDLDKYLKELEEIDSGASKLFSNLDGSLDIDPNFKPREKVKPIELDATAQIKSVEVDSLGLKIDIPEMPQTELLQGFDLQISNLSNSVVQFFDKYQDAINITGQLFGQMIENQMIALDNKHKKELNYIDTSTMSEEQKSIAIENLEKKTAKERAKILRKQAIAQKMASISSAIMNIAQAQTKTLADTGIFGIPLTSVIAALGAAQIATIAAQPIPTFAEGGIVSGPTLGLMGEYQGARMNPEVIAPLDKLESMISPNKPQTIIPDVRISGDDLLIIFNRAERKKIRR